MLGHNVSNFKSSPVADCGSVLHIIRIKCWKFLDLHKNIVHTNAENTQEIFGLAVVEEHLIISVLNNYPLTLLEGDESWVCLTSFSFEGVRKGETHSRDHSPLRCG